MGKLRNFEGIFFNFGFSDGFVSCPEYHHFLDHLEYEITNHKSSSTWRRPAIFLQFDLVNSVCV